MTDTRSINTAKCLECERLRDQIEQIRSRPEGMSAKQLRANNRKLREAADVAKAIANAEAQKMSGGIQALLDKYHDRAFRAEETARELKEAMLSWKAEAERLSAEQAKGGE